MQRYRLFGLLVLVVLACGFPPQAGAWDKDGAFVVGAIRRETLGVQSYGQLVGLLEQVMQVYSKKFGVPIKIEAFNGNSEAREAVKNHRVDLLLNNMTLAKEQGYTPFLSFGLFDETHPGYCLIVPKNKKVTAGNLSALKGGTAVVRKNSGAFLRLWEMTGQNPLAFFRRLTPAKNEPSVVYAVSLGEADAGVVDLHTLRFMAKSNPGAVGKVVEVACEQMCKSQFLISPEVSAKDRDRVKKYILGARKNPDLKRYLPALQQAGLTFSEVTKKDLQRCDELSAAEEAALKDGRLEIYERWRRYQ